MLAAQNGTDVVMGETTYTKYVQIDLKEGTTAYNLPLPAVKKTGATLYIGTIYLGFIDGWYRIFCFNIASSFGLYCIV